MPGGHFVWGPFQPHQGFLPDEEYGRVLDSLVIATVDVLVVGPKGKILLARRTMEPVKGRFETPGGRMRPGESFAQTAVRNTKRELGLNLPPDRFSWVTSNSFVWAKRAQPPEDHGSHTISTAMVVLLSDAEVAAIKLNAENSETLWILPEDVLKRAAEPEFEGAVVVPICRDYLAIKSVS